MKYVDDIIREERRRRYNLGTNPDLSFTWGMEGYEQLRKFVAAVIVCPHGLNCLCDYGDKVVDGHLRQGFRFLGAEHRWDRRRHEMLLSVKQLA